MPLRTLVMLAIQFAVLVTAGAPGSVDVSEVQQRHDVLTYTTAPLEADLDIVGPLTFILYASFTALDTDFCVRLSDVFADGRAIQLQSSFLQSGRPVGRTGRRSTDDLSRYEIPFASGGVLG